MVRQHYYQVSSRRPVRDTVKPVVKPPRVKLEKIGTRAYSNAAIGKLVKQHSANARTSENAKKLLSRMLKQAWMAGVFGKASAKEAQWVRTLLDQAFFSAQNSDRVTIKERDLQLAKRICSAGCNAWPI